MAAAEILGTEPLHPFYPLGLVLSGGVYVANDWDLLTLILVFFSGWAAILAVTLALVKKINPRLKRSDQLLVLWFILTGSIHLFFEGYFVLNHGSMASKQDFFGQLWKEYSLSDSRYQFSDPFVLCMETWTAITWGPLSLLAAVLITKDSPYRHPIQALVSTGQFYGCGLYYATSLFDEFYAGKTYYRPGWYYFWFYFVFMNSFWLIVPGYCLHSSIKETARAFRAAKSKSVNGSAKKSL
ncbi:EBP domain-containing protein [Bisporella sp. PMI_857]|nr:EBP domain-containing protein [Bisporella sp. PMI_857]